MRYRKLGSSGLEISEISLGAWLTYAGGLEFEQTRAVGASRPEQVHANASAAGTQLSADILEAIDDALGDAPVKEPTLALMANSGVKHR